MATIRFKTKVRNEGLIEVPAFRRHHCDMTAFRAHKIYGTIANSDLFLNALARIRRDVIGSDYRTYLRLATLPDNVQVDESGFLAEVTIIV